MGGKIYDIPVKSIDNHDTNLGEYQGKVLLVVNVASECGLTPQYEALQSVYDKYKEEGLVVLGFPANEFGAQEPGSNEQIQQFCQAKFNIKFPLFSKIVVKGEGQHPLYHYLTEVQPQAKESSDGTLKKTLEQYGLLSGGPKDIMWNFEKFLVDRNGEVVERFAPDIVPDDSVITTAIEAELAKG
jgi:glutathione peroxidase